MGTTVAVGADRFTIMAALLLVMCAAVARAETFALRTLNLAHRHGKRAAPRPRIVNDDGHQAAANPVGARAGVPHQCFGQRLLRRALPIPERATREQIV